MKKLTEQNHGLNAYLSLDEDEPLGVYLFCDYGAVNITLGEFFDESLIDMSDNMRSRYAKAFEMYSKKLWPRRTLKKDKK